MKFKITFIFLFVFSFSAYAHHHNQIEFSKEEAANKKDSLEQKKAFQLPMITFIQKTEKNTIRISPKKKD